MFPIYQKVLSVYFTSIFLILFAVSTFYVIRSSGYPLSFYGLTWDHWLQNSIEAILYSLPIMLLLIILKWVLIHNVDIFEGVPLFVSKEKLKGSLIILSVYTALAPVQEIIVRGCIQSALRNFFRGPNAVFMAILTSNLLFQILHTVKEFWLAIASFVLGLFWGFLFESQKSVLGVSISHMLIGAWAFFIVDFSTLIDLARASQRIP